MQPKLIVFDLNKTLIQENSWYKLNLAMGVTPEEDEMLMAWAGEGVIDDVIGQNILCNLYKSRGDVSYEHIWTVVRDYHYLPDAKQVVADLLRGGSTLALISGAMDILVRNVAEELHIPYWRAANTFIFDNNNMLSRIDAPPQDKYAKLEMLKELCNKLSIRTTDCLIVGDGANDIALFTETGNGVTFVGSSIASEAKYVISGLKELPALLS